MQHVKAMRNSFENKIARSELLLFGSLIVLFSVLFSVLLDWKIIVGFVAASLSLWFLLRYPPVTFALFLSSGYFKGDPLVSALTGPLDLTLVFAVILSLCLFWQVAVKRVSFRSLRNIWPMVAMIAFAALSLLYTPDLSYGLPKVGLLLTGVMLSLVAGSLILSRPRSLKTFLNTMVIIGSVMSIYAVVIGRTLGTNFINAFGSNYLTLGKASAISVFVLLFFNFEKNGFVAKTLKLLLSFVLLWSMMSSGGRGPVFAIVPALAIGCFAIWIKGDRFQFRRFVFVSIIIGLMIIVLLVSGLAGTTFINRASMVTDSFSDKTVALSGGSTIGGSASVRIRYWSASIKLWAEKPFTGVGIGGFNKAAFGTRGELYPHNIFFELAAELGIVGLCLLMLQLFLCWRSIMAFLNRNISRPAFSNGLILLLLIAYLLVNACLSGDLNDNRQLFALCGAAVALISYGEQTEDASI